VVSSAPPAHPLILAHQLIKLTTSFTNIGVIAHKSLTRQTFGILQARLFPVYFAISAALSSVLLIIWANANMDYVRHRHLEFGHPVTQQTWNLVGLLVFSVLNWFWIGPATNR
jgi:hypothetical protein